jgi:hypothetical protein
MSKMFFFSFFFFSTLNEWVKSGFDFKSVARKDRLKRFDGGGSYFS